MTNPSFWTLRNKRSLYLGIVLFFLSLIVQIGAGRYSSASAARATYAGDLFLDNLPVVHLDFLIVLGGVFVWAIALFALIKEYRYLLFGIRAMALFIIIRAFFINLTHIGLYPRPPFELAGGVLGSIYSLFTFQGNFFFSGHVGFPFLISLILWKHDRWRRFFFTVSFVFAVSVLLAHVHYSIDVFASPLITYGIFAISRRLFHRDYRAAHEPAES